MKEQNLLEGVFENLQDGRKHTAKMVFIDETYDSLKLYDRTSVARRLKYIGLNPDPDNAQITYRQIV